MTDLPADLVVRKGCTRREAELLRAALLLAEGDLPLSVLAAESRANLQPHVEAMKSLDDEAREALVDEWEVEFDFDAVIAGRDLEEHAKRLTPRWRQALQEAVERQKAGVAFGDERLARLVRSLAVEGAPRKTVVEPDLDSPLSPLLSLTPDELERWCVRYGAALLAVLETDLGRRKIARIARAVGDEDRGLMTRVLSDGVDVSDELRARVRELFIAVSEGDTPVTEQIRRMGLYFIALAAGQRWASEVEVLAAHLLPESSRLLMRFHAAIKRSSRAHLEVEIRQLLQTLTDER